MSQERDLWARLVSSEIKLQLLKLFNGEPKLSCGLDEIAKRIGRPEEEIKDDLEDLVEIGVIKKKPNPGAYSLDEEKYDQIQTSIRNHLLKNED